MFLSKFGNIKALIISGSHNNKLLQLWYQYDEPCHLIKWAESTVLAYKLTSHPWKVAVMIPMWASQMALLLSIPAKPEEIQALNENEWPGPRDLIAKAAFINT